MNLKNSTILAGLLAVSMSSFAFSNFSIIEVVYKDSNGVVIGGSVVNECRANSYHSWGTTVGAASTMTFSEPCQISINRN